MEYDSAINRNDTTDVCNDMDESRKHYVERKEPETKEYVIFPFI